MKCKCNDREFFPAKVRALVNGFERITTFKTGYICSIPFTQGNSHGKHGMELLFILKGKLGAIQFVIFTGWMPNYDSEQNKNNYFMPADIGAHSHKATYDGQSKTDSCPWLDNKPCYYDGSGLAASDVFKIFASNGEEAMWSELENFYKSWILEK